MAFASGCKDAPSPPAASAAPQPEPVSAGKPIATEALAEPAAAPQPVTTASSAAASSPAAPLPPTGPSERDKQGGASNTPTPALPPSPQAVATAPAAPAAPPAEAPSAPVAQSPEPPAVQVTSPKTSEAAFNLWMQSSGRYKAGQQGHVEIVLVPKGDYHCNEQYPYKFKAVGSTGVTFPQAIVMADSMSKSATRSVMRVPFVPASPGDARIAGKFHFSVCTAAQCLMDSRDVAVTVKVD